MWSSATMLAVLHSSLQMAISFVGGGPKTFFFFSENMDRLKSAHVVPDELMEVSFSSLTVSGDSEV